MSQGIGVDMIDVGKGDSYLIELKDEQGNNFRIAIDAGNESTVEDTISQARRYYGSTIELAISTHPDTDHIGGIQTLLEELNVANLVLNDPQALVPKSLLLRKAQQNLAPGEFITFKDAFDRIDKVKETAEKQGTKVHEFFGSNQPIHRVGGWEIYVVGPTKRLFDDLWQNDDTIKSWFNSDSLNTISVFKTSSVIDDPAIDTKPVNNTSIILLIEGYGQKFLFTGDAGKRAIREAATVKDISNLRFLDVPHHGSRRNMDSEIISLLSPKTSYISSPGNEKHPRKAIIKALQNTGSRVFSTCRHGSMYHNWQNERSNYNGIDPWPAL